MAADTSVCDSNFSVFLATCKSGCALDPKTDAACSVDCEVTGQAAYDSCVASVTAAASSSSASSTSSSTSFNSIVEQGIIFGNICTSADAACPCRDTGTCQLSDILQIFVNISTVILGLSGSIVLLMFFYGGLMWVIAAGNPKRIETGKQTMIRAVIGLAIIFGAYAIINFVIAGLAGKTPGATIEDTINSTTGTTGAENVIKSQ